MGRILGIDFGTKRIGAAISDPRGLIASPLEIFERRDRIQDARHYRKLVDEHEVERIVIGLPVQTGGKLGASANLAKAWGAWLAEVTSRPIVYFDERFTTVEAEESLIAIGYKRAKRKGLRDMLAARILLQNYLDDGAPESPKIASLQDPYLDEDD